MKTFYIAFCMIVISLSSYAQNQVINCGFDKKHKQLINTDKQYEESVRAMNQKIRKMIENDDLDQLKTQIVGPYTIPVVVHVLYKIEGGIEIGNISDAQIQSAINHMNDVYGGLIVPSPDVSIQFCLADQSPDCSTSTGINRIDLTNFTANGSAYATVGIDNNNEEAVKAQSFWPANQYYNIWLVTEIDDNNGEFGTQGYAYFPGLGNIQKDGAVLLYNTMGYDPGGSNGYDLKDFTQTNETLIHEMGHALGLYHTFADQGNETTCASNNVSDCNSTGDLVCDTEPHLNPVNTCPEGEVNTCTGAVYGDVLYNFMNYSTTACDDRFTLDQVARMQATMANNLFIEGGFISSGRSSLNFSQGCSGATSTNQNSYCTDETNNGNLANQLGTVSIEIGSIKAENATPLYDSEYYFGSTLVTHCELTTHEIGASVPVDLDVEAFAQTGDNFMHAKVYIDYNNDGDFLDSDPEEEVLLLNGTNTDDGLLNGSFVLPTKVAFPLLEVNIPLKMRVVSDFTGFQTGENITPCSVDYGQIEDFNIMVTNALPVNLLSFEAELKTKGVYLNWNVAHEFNTSHYKVEKSSDGHAFQHIATLSATSENVEKNYQYIDRNPHPGANYYRLTEVDNEGNIQFLGIRLVKRANREINIYPSPKRHNELSIIVPKSSTDHWEIAIFDIQGKLVYSGIKQSISNKIMLKDLALPAGSYVLKVNNEQEYFIKNMIQL